MPDRIHLPETAVEGATHVFRGPLRIEGFLTIGKQGIRGKTEGDSDAWLRRKPDSRCPRSGSAWPRRTIMPEYFPVGPKLAAHIARHQSNLRMPKYHTYTLPRVSIAGMTVVHKGPLHVFGMGDDASGRLTLERQDTARFVFSVVEGWTLKSLNRLPKRVEPLVVRPSVWERIASEDSDAL